MDLQKIHGVTVHVLCGHCKGARKVKGGEYPQYGEMIACPLCDGHGTRPEILDWPRFIGLMTISLENVKYRPGWSKKSPAKKRSTPRKRVAKRKSSKR